MRLPIVGEEWRHFKGTVYKILGFDYGAEEEELVLRVRYCKKSESNLIHFSRPLADFLGPVDTRAPARFTPHG